MSTSDWYNNLYQTNTHPFGRTPKKFISENLSLLKAGTTLDIGFGSGNETITLAENGQTVIAVDISKEASNILNTTAKIKNLAEKIKVITADVTDLNLSEISFDNCVLSLILHHLAPKNAQKLLNDIAINIPQGGMLFLYLLVRNPNENENSSNQFIPSADEFIKYWDKEIWEIKHNEIINSRKLDGNNQLVMSMVLKKRHWQK